VCAGLIFTLINAALYANEAELNLHAFDTLSTALCEHIAKHGEWPQSEAELAKITVNRGFSWPQEMAEIKNRTRILYGVTLRDVASSLPEKFPFLVSAEPQFRNVTIRRIENIIAVAQQHVSEDADSSPRGNDM